MHHDARMVSQKRLNRVGLVAAHVVANHVNLLPGTLRRYHLGEERDEPGANRAWRGLAEHIAGGEVQCGKQDQGAVALVFEAMALGAYGRPQQHPVLAIARLNRGLLIHLEHHCMRRRVQVQADDIRGFDLKVGIVGHHVSIEPMWSNVVLAPDGDHGVLGESPTSRPVPDSTPSATHHGEPI